EAPGEGVFLDAEAGDIEAVDDVHAGQVEVHHLIRGNDQRIVGNINAVLGIFVLPEELVADHLHVERGVVAAELHDMEGGEGVERDQRHHDGGNDGPGELQRVVLVEFRGLAAVAFV